MATRVRTVFAFGASNVSGMGANGASWARHLERDFYAANAPFCSGSDPSPHFYPLGVPGNTAQMLAARLPNDTTSRLREVPVTSIVSIGHTDALVLAESGKTRTSLDAFARHMGAITRYLTCIDGRPADVLYVGLTACNEGVVHTLRTGERIRYSNAALKQFEAVACEIIEAYGGLALPLLDASLDADLPERFLTPDGLHYTTSGYEWAYRQTRQAFMSMVA